MDEGHEVHADQPQVGPGLGDQQVHQAGLVSSLQSRLLIDLWSFTVIY